VDVRQELREDGRQAMADTHEGLRMAGGPEFEGELLISERLYDFVTDNGVDEDFPLGHGMGWYGLIRGGSFGGLWHGMLARDGFELTEAESDFLADQVGAILHESSCGFVDVEYYETTKELNADWATILSDYGNEN
jgi:hypothetical protein